ncbi:HAD hydrolase family [Cladochytrium replicatum]|nr:HAD hydrolase family [Cladochytrium replicatum]
MFALGAKNTTANLPMRKSLSDLPHFSLSELCALSDLSEDEYSERLKAIQAKQGFICDMDGVIYHGSLLLPGVKRFIDWLTKEKKKFIFLTNNSAPTPKELSRKLNRLGLSIPEEHFYTSALATARFLKSQKPQGGTCYVVGEPGLTYALYEAGFEMNEVDPHFVVIGEGNSHNFEKITKAVNLVNRGSRLIGTNPDANGPTENGIAPATGAFVSAIECATGKKAFYCGKPSALMMRYAQELLGTHKADTCMIGDRMDTDILAGTWAQIDPVLVMSGVTNPTNLTEHAYRPFIILNNVGEIAGPGTDEVAE